MATAAAQLWDRFRDYVVLGVLLLISLFVLFAQNGPLLRSARAGALGATAQVESAFSWVGGYATALSENERLRADAIDLASEVALLRAARAENERLRGLIGFADTTSLPLRAARVVDKDFTSPSNLLTIDVGRGDGVRDGMAVIDERGIVGKISIVGTDYSLVLPHQNTNFAVSARLDAIGRDGIVRWDGESTDELIMEYVPKTEKVEPGQLIVTSSYSDAFPAGLAVGRVDSVYAAPGRNDYLIRVLPAAPVGRVEYVYVVLREPNTELDSLKAVADAEGLR